jgi:hypothetical protein
MKRTAGVAFVFLLTACGGGGVAPSTAPPPAAKSGSTIPVQTGTLTAQGPYLYGTTSQNALNVFSESGNVFVEQIQQAGCDQVLLMSLAFSPDRSLLYVAESNDTTGSGPNQIGVLAASSNTFTGAIPIPATYYQIHGLTSSADGKTLYVDMLTSNSEYDTMGFVDTTSGSLTGTLQMPSSYVAPFAVDLANGLVYAAGTQFLNAPNTSEALIDVVDPGTRSVVKSFKLGGTTTKAEGPTFDAAGNLYVHYFNAFGSSSPLDEILVLDPTTGAQLATITRPNQNAPFGRTQPTMLITSANRLYVTNGNAIDVFDLNNNRSLAATISIPDSVYDSGMALNASQSTLYLSAGKYVYVISTQANAITGKFLVSPTYPQYTQNYLAAQ